jgi:serine/threonine protein kinase
VALKVLGSGSVGETVHAQLLREARNAAALNHPNICTVYEVGEASGSIHGKANGAAGSLGNRSRRPTLLECQF